MKNEWENAKGERSYKTKIKKYLEILINVECKGKAIMICMAVREGGRREYD